MLIEYRKGPKRKALPLLEIEPEEYVMKPVEKRVCTFDTETDPFEFGVVVEPFTCGFYDTVTEEYADFWGANCIDQFFAWLRVKYRDIECVIYCHNWGNFDAYFATHYFDGNSKPFLINGRIVRIFAGGQEFRDSYANIPVALGEYQKTEIDYALFVPERREANRELIRAYQKDDCIFLAQLVVPWLEMFGNKLTMASAALPMLRSYHGFDTLPESLDRIMRPYYFGGRNQCFSTGLHIGDFKVYDINSSYPNVMRAFKHPVSGAPRNEPKITSRTCFARIRAWSLGALPIRAKDGSLDFPIGTFDFFACIHEIEAGLETKTLRIIKVYESIYFDETASFGDFVDTFYKLRMKAKAAGDKVHTLFYKLLLNSSYGKFAQDPRKYENWLFDPDEVPEPLYCAPCHKRIKNNESPIPCDQCDALGSHSPYGWYLHTTHGDRQIYASPQRVRGSGFFNVATAASITSAARAQLLRGIQAATRPIYCDTDSIICEALSGSGINLDPIELGAWDIEAEGDTVCIAGKKLYAIFNNGEEVKKASKGVKLTAEQIRLVSEGNVVEYAHPVPNFSLALDPSAMTQEEIERKMFTVRKIKRTG